MEYWGLLFTVQRAIQIILPYIYLMFLEASVGCIFSLTVMFYA